MKHFKKILPICIILAGIILYPRAAFGLQKIVYSDAGIPTGAVVWTWDSYRGWGIGTAQATFNGNYIGGVPVDPNTCFQTISDNGNTYAGWGVFKNENMSSYAGGYLKFWVKTWNNLKVEIKDSSTHTKYISAYGWTSGDAGTWKEITIPINDGKLPRRRIVPRCVLGSLSNKTEKKAITTPLGIPSGAGVKLNAFQKIWPATPAAMKRETPLPRPHPFCSNSSNNIIIIPANSNWKKIKNALSIDTGPNAPPAIYATALKIVKNTASTF